MPTRSLHPCLAVAVVLQLKQSRERQEAAKRRKEEREDPAEVIEAKAAEIAALLGDSKQAVLYTGAGLSTSAGISDYRGPQGVWTRLDKGLAPPDYTPVESIRPTRGHMVVRALVDAGIVKHVVSQNVDGLHLRSGVPRGKLSELHGNW